MIWNLIDWVPVVVISGGSGYRIIDANLIRVSYSCISRYIHFKIPLKQLYTSNKTKCLSYKQRYGVCGHTYIRISKVFKRIAADKQLCIISNIISIITLRN